MKGVNFYIAAILGAVLLQGCAGPGANVPKPPAGIPLKEVCEKYNVTWQWDGVTQVVMLQYKNNLAKALVGSNVVVLGKERLHLSAPLRRANSTIYVPDDFESKVLAPFGLPTTTPRQVWGGMRFRTIVLDAGHGGKDPGAQGRGGSREKDIVLDITMRLKNLLEEAGFKIILTRDRDEFISLPERTEIASKSDADLFVSIHANSNPSRKIEGMEVYYIKSQSKRDLDEDQRQKNEWIHAKHKNMRSTQTNTNILSDMLYAYKAAESGALAMNVVNNASRHINALNRGARNCRFFVVRNTLIPAVLVEVGFVTNRQEEKLLQTSLYRQKIAEGISRSIISYASES